MRIVPFIGCVLWLLTASDATAQWTPEEEAPRGMSVVVSPWGIFRGALDAKYSLKVADRIALVFPVVVQEPRFALFPLDLNTLRAFNYGELSLGVGARFFLSDAAFKSGWYIEPSFSVAGFWISTATPSTIVDDVRLSGVVVGGYSWQTRSGFCASLGIGARYDYLAVYQTASRNGFGPTAELAFGYAW